VGKASQHQPTDSTEPLAALGAAGQRWLKDHRGMAQAAAGGLLLLLLGLGASGFYARRQARQAGCRFAEGLALLHPTVAPGSAASAPSAGDANALRQHDQDPNLWRQALPIFTEVAAAAPRAGIGHLAALEAGALHDRLRDLPAAQRTYEALLGRLRPADPLYFFAAERLAYVHEAAGDLPAARAALDPLAADETVFYADHAQFQQARLHLAEGDAAAARQILQSIERTFPNSSLLDEVQSQLRILEADMPAPASDVSKGPGAPGDPLAAPGAAKPAQP
jgi:tetratricopeptide (TPR) repeat protein